MKFLNLFLAASVFLSSSLLYAKPRAYFDMKDSFFTSPSLHIDGNQVPVGFWGFRNLPEAFNKDPLAKALAEDHVLYRNWGTGLVFGGLGLAIAYSAVTLNDEDQDYNSGTYWGLFLLGFIPGVIMQSRANTKLVRAINQYNGVYESNKAHWEFAPSTKGLGLALRF